MLSVCLFGNHGYFQTQAVELASGTKKSADLPADDFLDLIVTEMGVVVETVTAENTEDQTEVDQSNVEVVDQYVVVDSHDTASKKVTHEICRQAQVQAGSNERLVCQALVGHYEGSLYSTDSGDVLPTGAPTCFQNGESWKVKLDNLLGSHVRSTAWQAQLQTLTTSCVSKKEGSGNKLAECDLAQRSFEDEFCSYKNAAKLGCLVLKQQTETGANVQVRLTHRQDLILSTKKVICFVTAMKNAKSGAINVQECLDLTFATLPEENRVTITFPQHTHVCDVADALRPGTDAWYDAHYKTLPHGLKDILTDVSNCPSDSTTTTTLAAPEQWTKDDVKGYCRDKHSGFSRAGGFCKCRGTSIKDLEDIMNELSANFVCTQISLSTGMISYQLAKEAPTNCPCSESYQGGHDVTEYKIDPDPGGDQQFWLRG